MTVGTPGSGPKSSRVNLRTGLGSLTLGTASRPVAALGDSTAVPSVMRGCWLAGLGVPSVTQRSRLTSAARNSDRYSRQLKAWAPR